MQLLAVQMKNKIVSIGLRGIGTLVGYQLAAFYANNPDYEITFFVRQANFHIIQTSGLQLNSTDRSTSAVYPNQLLCDYKALSPQDLYILSIKESDLEYTCYQLQDQITENSVILVLIIGSDIYRRMREIIPQGVILSGAFDSTSPFSPAPRPRACGPRLPIRIHSDPLYPSYEADCWIRTLQMAGIACSGPSDSK